MILAFGRSRLLRAIAGVLVIGGAVGVLLRLGRRVIDGNGLTSFATRLGIETTPVEAIVALGFGALVLGGVELLVWLRGVSRTRPRRRRARGPA